MLAAFCGSRKWAKWDESPKTRYRYLMQVSSQKAPPAAISERPVLYADEIGNAYSNACPPEKRKEQGLYLTPPVIADFMARQSGLHGGVLRILDPAAGGGILICSLVESLIQDKRQPRSIEVIAFEIDADLSAILTKVLDNLVKWSGQRGTAVTYKVVNADFVLKHAAALEGRGSFFPHLAPKDAFDIVIANPPYFKLNKSDPRAKATASIIHGQPNIYGLFMAVGAAMLRQGGEFIYITPRSFASGPYFRLFREKFFDCIRPEVVHIFDSRKDAFNRDAVLQENIIIKGTRQDGWPNRLASELMTISTCSGLGDLQQASRRVVKLDEILDLASHDKVLKLPATTEEDSLIKLVEGWLGSLNAYGFKISTGPVVPFRARELIDMEGALSTHVPLLWMNHIRPMQQTWPLGRHKPEYIKNTPEARALLVANQNYVLLRRFSAKEEKRRLVAAPYFAASLQIDTLGLENHLNYIYRPNGSLTDDETRGLAVLFNSALLDTYFRTSNGNTQVSATELRKMPLPPLETIVAIGHRAKNLKNTEELDELVVELALHSTHRKVRNVG